MLRWLFRSKYAAPGSRNPSSRRSKASKGSPIDQIRERLNNCTDVVIQPVLVDQSISCTLVYIDSIIDKITLQDHVLKRMLQQNDHTSQRHLLDRITSGSYFTMQVGTTNDVEETVTSIMEGKAALIIGNQSTICLLPIAKYTHRAVSEAQNEMVIIGPQEAFIENVDTNLAMLRHKVKHPDLKIVQQVVGTYTKTRVFISYIDGLCDPKTLEEIESKIKSIDRNSILGGSYIAENLDPTPYSPFPLIQFSERPDTVASSLLEGRISIFVDGTPQSLIVPVTFFTLMQSPEDYYQSFLASTWIRWIRYFFLIVSFLTPSLYVAVTTFHPEMIPPALLASTAAARENIPFPALAEVLLMELTFEALREAGIRIPKPLGQTVSIIGAIVIGQSAVQAGLVSATTVIVVSITGVASFIIPHFELGLAFRLLRFPLIILGGSFGIFGIIIGLFIIYWHLVSLNSFGVAYMQPLAPLVLKDWKDVFVRSPWSMMRERPSMYGTKQDQRDGSENE